MCRSWEGTRSQHGDIPILVGGVLSSKNGGKEEGQDAHSDSICLPKKSLHVISPAFLGVAEQLPAKGKQ